VLSEKIKYWLKPDLENRIKEGSIRALFNTTIEEIRAASSVLRTPEGRMEIDNDWVLAMTGYRPDYPFLESLGLGFREDDCRAPVFDDATFETTRAGVYVAGTVCGGYCTSRWFIENGRFHARQIAKHIAGRPAEPIQFGAVHWKTEE
jgi:thioredoxin reductase (NADPH)